MPKAIPPGTMCFACSEKPATVNKGTVPLCADCAQVASGNKRGVKVVKPPKKASGTSHPA